MNKYEEWFNKAKQVKNLEELNQFYKELFVDTFQDYETVHRAIAAFGFAAANMTACNEGITGFQASCVIANIVRQWCFPNNEVGFRILDYDNLLYPQYEKYFEKSITKRDWQEIQDAAKKKLESDNGCSEVRAHWQSIVDGKVPFGYIVEE